MVTPAFLETVFIRAPGQGVPPFDAWRDISTSEYFIFQSAFGGIRLRKRLAYPATFAYAEGPVLHYGYGDRSRGEQALSAPLRGMPEETFYGGEFLHIAADAAGAAVSVQRDAFSTLPLFIGAQNGRFVASNKYEWVYGQLDPRLLTQHDYALAMLMLGSLTGKTLFADIHTLYDRQRAVWNHDGFVLEQPPDGSVRQVAKQRHGDAREFFAQLEDTLDTYWQRYAAGGTAGAELSGGMDSSSIAGYYASRQRPLLPVTLTYTGPHQQSVQARLETLQGRFGITSHQIAMDTARDYPLAGHYQAGALRPFYHEEEIYAPSIHALAGHLQSNNVRVVFRGVGGDELFENYPDMADESNANPLFPKNLAIPPYLTPEFHSFARTAIQSTTPDPVPLLSRSVAAAGLSAGNTYIDYGIWPVLPLADPQLYVYCQSLPVRYRNDRAVLRAYLHARNYPEAIHTPVSNEHFGNFFSQAVAIGLPAVFAHYMQDPVLARRGFLDTAHALEAWRHATQTGDYRSLSKLFCLLKAEAALQDWEQRLQAPGQPAERAAVPQL